MLVFPLVLASHLSARSQMGMMMPSSLLPLLPVLEILLLPRVSLWLLFEQSRTFLTHEMDMTSTLGSLLHDILPPPRTFCTTPFVHHIL
jgi:hypothetical protein